MYKFGNLDIYELSVKNKQNVLGGGATRYFIPIQQYSKCLFRHAIEYYSDVLYLFLAPNYKNAKIEQLTPDDVTVRTRNTKKIVLKGLWGDVDNNNPVILTYTGGAPNENEIYKQINQAVMDLFDSVSKLSNAPASLASSQWQDFLSRIDDSVQEKFRLLAQNAPEGELYRYMMLMFQPFLTQSDVVYILDLGQVYITVIKEKGSNPQSDYQYLFFKNDNGKILLTNYNDQISITEALNDDRFRGPFFDSILNSDSQNISQKSNVK